MIKYTDEETLREYSKDAANIKGDAGELYFPQSASELQALVRECYEKRIAMTFQGSRTALTGSCVPEGGAIISTERMDKIISIDKDNLTVTTEPGVRISDLYAALDPYGLLYPSNPTETFSTIGGNVATNASGSKSFKYGPTRSFVMGLEVITGDGELLKLTRGENFAVNGKLVLVSENGKSYELHTTDYPSPDCTKNAAGLRLSPGMDAIDLFIASEGILGVVSQVTVKVVPKPEMLLGAIVFFSGKDTMLGFVKELRQSHKEDKADSPDVRLLEYFDHNALRLLKPHYAQIPAEALYAIWIEQECTNENADTLIEKIYALVGKYSKMADNTWFAQTDTEHKRLTDFRHKVPLEINELLEKYGQAKLYTDTAVSEEHFPAYFDLMYGKLEEYGLDHVVFGHIGDCHLHANLFMRSDEEKQRAMKFYNEMVEAALDFKGTFSAEHGVGKIKKDYLRKMYGPDFIENIREIKSVLDPAGLFGKGTMID